MTDYTPNGIKTILVGDSGAGKTHAIQTYLEAGVTPFVIFTENSMVTLMDKAGDPPCKIHWKYISPTPPDFKSILKMAKKVNTMGFKALQEMEPIDKTHYTQIYEVYETCNDFICDRCGESFGPVHGWNTDRVLVIDSLTGLNDMCMQLNAGGKVVTRRADWQIGMNVQMTAIKAFVSVHCHLTIIAHLARMEDEISGGYTNLLNALGTKNAPKIEKEMDEIILAKCKNGEFTWATVDPRTTVKTRVLGFSKSLPPSFAGLIRAWEAKGGKIIETKKEAIDATAGTWYATVKVSE